MVSDTLMMDSAIRLVGVSAGNGWSAGEERRGSRIRALPSFARGKYMIENRALSSGGDPYFHWSGLKGLTLYGKEDRSIKGVNLGPMGDTSSLEGIIFHSFDVAIKLSGVQVAAYLQRCTFYYSKIGILIEESDGLVRLDTLMFDACPRSIHVRNSAGHIMLTSLHYERETDHGETEIVLLEDFHGLFRLEAAQIHAGKHRPIDSVIRLARSKTRWDPRVSWTGVRASANFILKDDIAGQHALATIGEGARWSSGEWGIVDHGGMGNGGRTRLYSPLEMRHVQIEPPAPPAGEVALFARQKSGRTELCAKFPNGEIQVVAAPR
jgi:hypothetical protein